MTNIIELMTMSPKLFADEYGSSEYTFIVPVTKPGIYTVKAYSFTGDGGLVVGEELASASFTIVDITPMDLEIDVGSMHFRGEIAEFYAKKAFNGTLIDATITKAVLYYSNGTLSVDLTTNVERISIGLYRIPYAIPVNAPLGTYTLVVESSFTTELVESHGVSSNSFIISPTLTSEGALLTDIKDEIATIIIPNLATIKANLTAISAKLVSIEGRMATIESDIGTIKTDVSIIKARITAIEGNTVTITSDVGTIKSEVAPTGFALGAAATALSLIAAIGAWLSTMLIRKKTAPK